MSAGGWVSALAAAALAAGVVVSGGSPASPTGTPRPVVTYPAPAVTPDEEAVFLLVVRSAPETAFLAQNPDATIVDHGRTACAALGRGVSFGEMVAQAGTDLRVGRGISYVIGAAVGSLCPEHRALLP